MKIVISIILIALVIYLLIVRNPLNAYLSTHNAKFARNVFGWQFKCDQFEFTHKIKKYIEDNELS